MSRIINGKVVNDTEAATESFPDSYIFSGTSIKRTGTGKKSVMFNLNETGALEDDPEVRHRQVKNNSTLC